MNAGGARGRTEWRDVDGIVLLDKPPGLGSNAALQRVRRLYRARKAGHTGSLDPLASGVLPLCFGQATKVAGLLLEADKIYHATLALGLRTDTGDREGVIVERLPVPVLGPAAVARVLARFVGTSEQVPPMYSALKRAGQPLYALARRGLEVERVARRITITRLAALAVGEGSLSFEVACSKGTYVRTLAEDIARAFGTCGHLAQLRRIAIAGFEGQGLHTLEALERLAGEIEALDALLLPVDAPLAHLPAIVLGADAATALCLGRAVATARGPTGRVRLYDERRRFLGLGEVAAGREVVAPLRLMCAVAG